MAAIADRTLTGIMFRSGKSSLSNWSRISVKEGTMSGNVGVLIVFVVMNRVRRGAMIPPILIDT